MHILISGFIQRGGSRTQWVASSFERAVAIKKEATGESG